MYQYVNVANQAEFDAAIAAGDYPHITNNGRYEIREIPKGHTIKVSGTAKPHLVAYGSSSPRTEAYGSSSPLTVAYGSSSPRTVAYGSSSPRTEAYDSSSPRTVAHDSSSPLTEAYDSSSPRTVAYGSSSPLTEAYDSSSPRTEAHDYSSVLHAGRGTVTADEHVTVRTSGEVTVTGGAHVQRVPLTTNPAVLRSSLAFIQAHPEQWNQGAWAMKTDCGTAYCMAGHIVAQVGGRMDVENSTVEVASLPESVRPRFRLEHVQISAAARAIAGMGEDTAERLFNGSNDLEDLRELVDEICAGAFDPQPSASADTVPADAQ